MSETKQRIEDSTAARDAPRAPVYVSLLLIGAAVVLLQGAAFFATKPADVFDQVLELKREIDERPTREEFQAFLEANPQLNPPRSMRLPPPKDWEP